LRRAMRCVMVLAMTLAAMNVQADDLWIIGHVNDYLDFYPNKGVKMNQTADNKWTANITVNGVDNGYGYFSFTHQLADDWNTMNSNNRVGPYTADILIDENTEIQCVKSNENSIKCLAGDYNLNVRKESWGTYYVTLKKVEMNKDLYIIGQVNGNTSSPWDISTGVQLTWNDAKSAYTGRITTSDDSYFSFTTKLASTPDGWDEIANDRIGMVSDGNWWLTEERLGTTSAMKKGGESVKAIAGTWDVMVDLASMQLTINRVIPDAGEPAPADLDVWTTFNLRNTTGWAYNDETKTASCIHLVRDALDGIATYTFTATDPRWTANTWKTYFDNEHGMLMSQAPTSTSFTVKVEHQSGEYSHYLNTVTAQLWNDVEKKWKTIIDLGNIASLSADITQMIQSYGNAYDKHEIDGTIYNYSEVGIPQDETTEITATYNKVTWGDYHLAQITLRDDWMSTDIADVHDTHRGFKWRIVDEMVPVVYYAGVAYCRSLKNARVERPKPAPNQVPFYFIDYTDKNYSQHMDRYGWDQYTNYNWIALHLNDADIQAWNGGEEYAEDAPLDQAEQNFNAQKRDHVIKKGSIRGTFFDWSQNTSHLQFAFLNPDIKCIEPVITTDEIVTTKRNNYDMYNLVCQKHVDINDVTSQSTMLRADLSNPFDVDSIFLMPPKRNEVCNIRDAVVDQNREGYQGFWNKRVPYNNTDTCELNARVFVIERGGDWLKEVFQHVQWGHVHQLDNIVVKASDITGSEYSDHLDEHYKPNGHYYWPNYYEQTVLYNGPVPDHSLVIEPRTAGRQFFKYSDPDNPTTRIVETSVDRMVTDISYYDLMGRRLSTPHEGINIVVTRYNDGTASVKKMMLTGINQ